MIRSSSVGEDTWADRVQRAPLYAFGVIVAVMVALLIGMLTASPAEAKIFTVNSTANPGTGICDATECTLQEAVNEASFNGESDTINFAAGLSGEIPLRTTGGQGGFSILNDTPAVDLTINGPGARVLAVNGNNETRPFGIASGANATIKGLTIKNGLVGEGGGIYNQGTLTLTNSTVENGTAQVWGGGIYNDPNGTLTLTGSTVRGNNAGEGSGIVLDGGGIYNRGTLTLTNSTVSGNDAASRGGGIYNLQGTVTMTNSTLSGNTSHFFGGGIRNLAGTVTMTNSTVSTNAATNNSGGGISISSDSPSTTVRNTIIARNSAFSAPDVEGLVNSQGTNLIGAISGSSGWVDSDLLNRDPLLGPLQDNAGPTNTRALLPGSPAIDAATNTGCPITDQRGAARRDGDRDGTVVCDIGAYERSDFKSPTVASTTPADGATGVRRSANLTGTFSEKMTRSTLNTSTFELFRINQDGSTTQIANVTVGSTADGLKATLNPFGTSSTLLGANTTYRAVVTTGARDLAGNQLDQSPTVAGKQQQFWTFRTGGT